MRNLQQQQQEQEQEQKVSDVVTTSSWGGGSNRIAAINLDGTPPPHITDSPDKQFDHHDENLEHDEVNYSHNNLFNFFLCYAFLNIQLCIFG